MKIHAIRVTSDMFLNIFGAYNVIENKLSNDAELLTIDRLPGSNSWEVLFLAESGVETPEGAVIMFKNPVIQNNNKEKSTVRPAEPRDIFVGHKLLLIGDDNIPYIIMVEEVLNPEDKSKGFVADDGCRYGLKDLWVLE